MNEDFITKINLKFEYLFKKIDDLEIVVKNLDQSVFNLDNEVDKIVDDINNISNDKES